MRLSYWALYDVSGAGSRYYGSWRVEDPECGVPEILFSVCPVCGVSSRALSNSGQGATVNHLQLPSPLSLTVSQPRLQRPPILSLFIFSSPSTYTTLTYIHPVPYLPTYTHFLLPSLFPQVSVDPSSPRDNPRLQSRGPETTARQPWDLQRKPFESSPINCGCDSRPVGHTFWIHPASTPTRHPCTRYGTNFLSSMCSALHSSLEQIPILY